MLYHLFAVYFSYATKNLPEFSSKKWTIWSLGQGEAVGVFFEFNSHGFHGGSFRSNACETTFEIQIFQVYKSGNHPVDGSEIPNNNQRSDV